MSVENSDKKSRIVHRTVTMIGLTPNENGGYMMAGDTTAEVQVTEEGIRIRVKAKYEFWRFIPWAEVWINAVREG